MVVSLLRGEAGEGMQCSLSGIVFFCDFQQKNTMPVIAGDGEVNARGRVWNGTGRI